MNRSPCREEAERLLALADAMSAAAGGFEKLLSAWMADARRLLASSELESLSGEWALVRLSLALRLAWMQNAHGASDAHLKSPLLAVAKVLPTSRRIEYSYERNIRPEPLEARCRDYRPAPKGWDAAHVLFSSGMSALATFLQSYLAMVRPSLSESLRLSMWGGYFETHVLLELLSHPSFHWARAQSQQQLFEEVAGGGTDVVLLEPVGYDWDLEVLDVTGFLRAWNRRRGARPDIVILDTTLTGASFPVPQLLEKLSAAPPSFVVQTSSGLKLDQEGMELSNVGILSVYSPSGTAKHHPSAEEIARLLRKMRTIVGSGLSMDEICLLDVPFFLHPGSLAEHAGRVFLGNALLAHSIPAGNGLFSKVVHPSLGPRAASPWARAPFVVLHLSEDTLQAHGLLLAVVEHEARRRNICLQMGSSFGFRGHRFEVILPRLSDRRGLFKVAIGSRAGPSRTAVVQLFQELADVSSYAALRARWPDVTPVDLDRVEE